MCLKPTRTPQYITVFFCGTLGNTQQYTAPHHTSCILLALYFISLLQNTCDNFLWKNELASDCLIYLTLSNFFLYGSWSANGVTGTSETPAFSIKFHMWPSHKFLCVILVLCDIRRRKLFTVIMSNRNFVCLLSCLLLDWVTVGHSVTFINIFCVLVTVVCNFYLQSVSMFIAEVTFCCWCIVHIYQYIHITFVSRLLP
jgi:hypothetical protein